MSVITNRVVMDETDTGEASSSPAPFSEWRSYEEVVAEEAAKEAKEYASGETHESLGKAAKNVLFYSGSASSMVVAIALVIVQFIDISPEAAIVIAGAMIPPLNTFGVTIKKLLDRI